MTDSRARARKIQHNPGVSCTNARNEGLEHVPQGQPERAPKAKAGELC